MGNSAQVPAKTLIVTEGGHQVDEETGEVIEHPDKNDDNPLIQLAPLWKYENKGGKYLAGSVGNVRYFVFPNKKKKNDKEPDFQIVIGRRKQQSKKAEGDFIE